MSITAPYGSWTSPITAELITAQSTGLGAAVVDGERTIWAEARPERDGQISLVRQDGDGAPIEIVGGPHSVRTRVHEYGGGAWAVAGDLLVFSDFATNRLFTLDLADPEAEPQPLGPDEPGLRYAALSLHGTGGTTIDGWPDGLVLAVREDHRHLTGTPGGPGSADSPAEAVNTVVALGLDRSDPRTADGGVVVCSGADFYADPALAADGRLAWIEWDHPSMPWDGTRLKVGRLTGGAEQPEVADVGQLAGGEAESVAHPGWTPGGDLIFVSDRSGWWNLYRIRTGAAAGDSGGGGVGGEGAVAEALYPQQADFAPPAWVLGAHPYLVLDDDRLVCCWSSDNVDHLGVLAIDEARMTPIETDAVSIGSLHSDGVSLVAGLGFADAPRALAITPVPGPDPDGSAAGSGWRTLARSTAMFLSPDLVSRAEPVNWDGPDGLVHAWFYPPTNPAHVAPEGERPPLITISHGGPTSASLPAFNLGLQYWTSRGFAVLDVNYGGSTGYGRPYRERLKGRWGLVDVTDCADGALAMVDQGRADRARLVVRGGSAGGYTTLRALTATDVFTAGISFYGVGDLEILARDSHKFESRYLDSLVGPYPERIEVYHDRSPIYHLDSLSAPILLLQGRDDKVVPPNQAELFAASAREQGLPVALIMYDGEGHGFRRPENVRSSLEASLYFLGRVFGFTPADQLEPITIDNLSAAAG